MEAPPVLRFTLGSGDLDESARRVAKRWLWYVLGGLGVAVVGLLLLMDLFTAARTIAFLVALALAFQGIDEIVNASRYRPPWIGYVLGTLYLATSIWAVSWPGITLWALAVVVGVGFLVTGVAELAMVLRYHHELPRRGMFVALGVLSVISGLASLFWPAATILVLAILLGIRVLGQGIALIAFGLALRTYARHVTS
jgi:uncharacterized membrane protein HdeD (DUF308 family)